MQSWVSYYNLKTSFSFFFTLVAKTPQFGFGKRKKRQFAGGGQNMAEYFSISAYPEPYCSFASKADTACLENSIIELWAHEGSYDKVTGNINNILK